MRVKAEVIKQVLVARASMPFMRDLSKISEKFRIEVVDYEHLSYTMPFDYAVQPLHTEDANFIGSVSIFWRNNPTRFAVLVRGGSSESDAECGGCRVR